MEAKMMLREFTSETTVDGSKIVRVRARVSDLADRDAQNDWIEFQIEVDVPTVRSGALLRREALQQASETLRALAQDFERIAGQ